MGGRVVMPCLGCTMRSGEVAAHWQQGRSRIQGKAEEGSATKDNAHAGKQGGEWAWEDDLHKATRGRKAREGPHEQG